MTDLADDETSAQVIEIGVIEPAPSDSPLAAEYYSVELVGEPLPSIRPEDYFSATSPLYGLRLTWQGLFLQLSREKPLRVHREHLLMMLSPHGFNLWSDGYHERALQDIERVARELVLPRDPDEEAAELQRMQAEEAEARRTCRVPADELNRARWLVPEGYFEYQGLSDDAHKARHGELLQLHYDRLTRLSLEALGWLFQQRTARVWAELERKNVDASRWWQRRAKTGGRPKVTDEESEELVHLRDHCLPRWELYQLVRKFMPKADTLTDPNRAMTKRLERARPKFPRECCRLCKRDEYPQPR